MYRFDGTPMVSVAPEIDIPEVFVHRFRDSRTSTREFSYG